MSDEREPAPPRPEAVKLVEVLPAELARMAPLSVLLSQRQPHSFTEYPLAFLLAMELPGEIADRYAHYARGRCSS